MFNHISWQSYWIFLAISIALYYLVIASVFYTNEIQSLRVRKRKIVSSTPLPSYRETEPTITQQDFFDVDKVLLKPKDTEEDTAFVVQFLVDEVQAFLEAAQQLGYTKEQIIPSLRQLLTKFPSLKYSPYQTSVLNLIAFECENKCSIHLSADDLTKVWNG